MKNVGEGALTEMRWVEEWWNIWKIAVHIVMEWNKLNGCANSLENFAWVMLKVVITNEIHLSEVSGELEDDRRMNKKKSDLSSYEKCLL